jgi:hypothetical protein
MQPSKKTTDAAKPSGPFSPKTRRTPLEDEPAPAEMGQRGVLTGRDWDAEEAEGVEPASDLERGDASMRRPDPVLVDPTEDRE